MIDANEFTEIWKDRIERDLTSFGDPGVTVNVTRSGRNLHAEWTMRGKNQEATFSTSLDQGVSVKLRGRNLTYRSFVAGSEIADLKAVARMILQTSEPKPFIATKAKCLSTNSSSRPAVDVLTELLEQEETGIRTRVVMVTGDAGAGKTRVLQELVRCQAENYIHGKTTKLLLYVNAQGRALARLDEALATELQDLKVSLTYHSVSVLARLGILVPVIDGFDELLGISGYDDAFSSLSGFLDQLEGEGQVLASARSVYYEEEFLARANRVSTTGQIWEHIPVRVLAWESDDREQYLDVLKNVEKLSDLESENLRERLQNIFDNKNETLASKPLFFTRIVDLIRRNPQFSGGSDLLRAVVEEYLSREREEKLLDRQSEPLVTKKQFEHLMQELAEEMWNQETRELDYRSVREVAEYVVESEGLPEAAKQSIIERMPTLAFLARSDNPASQARISFEHELFFFYFLARSIMSQLILTEGDVRIILSRSALPEDVADRVAIELGIDRREQLQGFIDCLSRAGKTQWKRTAQVRENSGLLVLALIREYARYYNGKFDGLIIQSVVFPGSHLKNISLNQCSLIDVTFRRTDLSYTKFENCTAQNLLFLDPRMTLEHTRLELQGLEVWQMQGIRVQSSDSAETSYDPAFIADILIRCGTPIPIDQQNSNRQVSQEYIHLLERLMRAYRRTDPVCMGDNNLSAIFRHPKWRTLERLLVKHRVVEKKSRSTSGRPQEFLWRQFLPEQIMSGLIKRTGDNPQIQEFWQALESETTSKSR